MPMRSLFIIAMCGLVASCDYRGSAKEGTVLEVTNFEAPSTEWKFRPIPGAEIAVYWEGLRRWPSHGGRAYCLAVTYVTSDAAGRFHAEGRSVPRAVDGISEITPISLAYVPGFVQLRPHEHDSSIWGESPTNHPAVHVFRRAGRNDADVRADALYNAKFCPSAEFRETHAAAPHVSGN